MSEIEQKIRDAIEDHETRLHKKSRTMFKPPTVKEIDDYCIEKGIAVRPDYIWNFYEQKGWKVGKSLMKNWRSAVSQSQYWESAPRRKLPAKADSEAEQKALEKCRQEIRDNEGHYFGVQTTETLTEWVADSYSLHITRRWLIREILQERQSNE